MNVYRVAGVVAEEDAGPGIAGGRRAATISGASRRSGTVAVGNAVQISDTVADSLGDHVVSVVASVVLRKKACVSWKERKYHQGTTT